MEMEGRAIFIIISLLMSALLGTGLPYGLPTSRTGHKPPRGPSEDWWVLTITNTARTNGLTCLAKHGGARDNTFLVTHPLTDQCCLASAIAEDIDHGAIKLLHIS
jgi:hypothetical protein